MNEPKAEILDEKGIQRAQVRIAFEIIERNKGIDNLCIIGVLTRGKYIAQNIVKKIEDVENCKINSGFLDISKFRDDLTGVIDYEDKSEINFEIAGKKVVLVDDVIYTGRTVRAAIDALMARGRPENIQLAVLIDRGHRDIPIRPDYIGKNLPTSNEEVVRVLVEQIDGVNKVVII